MALVLRPASRKIALPDRLVELGRVRRRAAVFTGFFRLVAFAVLALLVLCTLDAVFHFPGGLRAVGLVAWLGLTVTHLSRGVGEAMRQSVKPLSMAMLIEEKFPKFNDALASAVEFLIQPKPSNRSQRFHDVTILRAENLAKRIPMGDIVPMGRMWKSLWLLFATMLVVVPLAGWNPVRTTVAAMRFFDPLGEHQYPTRTLINLETGGPNMLLAKGDSFPVRFQISGELPETATLTIRLSAASTSDEIIPLENPDKAKSIGVDYRIDAGRIPRDFSFRIAAGDAMTPWQAVEVAPPPKLVPHEGRPTPILSLTFPTYTDLTPIALPDGSGVVEAVNGTRIHFLAEADRRIISAQLVPQFDTTNTATATAVAALSSQNPLAALGAQLLADDFTQAIPLHIHGSEYTLLEAHLEIHQPGLYALRFTDERGLTGVRLMEFRIFPDPAPIVILERPIAGKDAFRLLPTSTILVQAHAEDRPYAVRNLEVEYRFGADGSWQTLPLADLRKCEQALPALTGSALVTTAPKLFTLDAQLRLPLSVMKKPNGQTASDGDTITLRVSGEDWDNVTALKAPGRSKEIELKILGKPSLEAVLLKELADLRPEFLRLESQLQDATAKTEELKKKAATGRLTPEEQAKLVAVEEAQKNLKAKLSDPAEGLRAKVDALQLTAQTNNLKRTPTADKLDSINSDLGKLTDQNLDAAETALAEANTKPDPKSVTDNLKKAVQSQQAAAKNIQNILEKLEQWGGAGEIRGEARNLKDQVARAGEQASKANSKVSPDKSPDKLTPSEKAELSGAAEKMDSVAERTADLINKSGRIADEKTNAANKANSEADIRDKAAAATPNPDDAASLKAEADELRKAAKQLQAEADAIRNAIRQAGGDELPADLRKAAENTREQRPAEADAARQSAQDRLDKIADSLSEQPTPSNDELTKKRQANTEQIDRIASEQEELRKKTKQAAAMPDSPERDEALKKLAAEQERLRKKTEDLLQRLEREPQSEKTAENLRKAADKMEAARDELENGKAATQKQEEAVDKLDEALEKLDRNQKQDKQELDREQREKITEKLKLLRDRQKAAVAEAERIKMAAETAKRWDRALQRSLRDLGEVEVALAGDVQKLAETLEPKLPVFGKLTQHSADAMNRAAKAITTRADDIADLDPEQPFDAPAEKLGHNRVLKPMALALKRLDTILDSLKDDPKKNKPQGSDKPEEQLDRPPPPVNDGQEAKPQGDNLPAMAQLKALRAMQADVNERTVQFAEEHPDSTALTEDDQRELQELEQAQRDVALLFQKMAEELRRSREEQP